jgi:hypothetical protein
MSSTAVLVAVEQLCSADLSVADLCALQADAQDVRLAIGRLQGRLDEILGEIESRGGARDEDDKPVPTYAWWRDAATLDGRQAGRDVRRAAVLRELPVIGAAVTAGQLGHEQAAVLCRLHGRIGAEELVESQAALVSLGQSMTAEALAHQVRQIIARHNEQSLELEQAAARGRRYLQLRREPDGTVRGSFRVPDEDAEVLMTVLEPLARSEGLHDQRSAPQRRADALVDVFAGAARWMDLPDAGGQRPQVTYVMSAAWCAGDTAPPLAWTLAQAAGCRPSGTSPRAPAHADAHTASGAWTGPQTRPRMEAVLCDARVSRLLLDPEGRVVTLTTTNDRITAAQRRAVSARDRHCVARGCTRPPAFCDVHHVVSREDGGPTEIGNLVLLCRRHHVAWHRGRLHLWQLRAPWLQGLSDHSEDEEPWDGHAPPLIA